MKRLSAAQSSRFSLVGAVLMFVLAALTLALGKSAWTVGAGFVGVWFLIDYLRMERFLKSQEETPVVPQAPTAAELLESHFAHETQPGLGVQTGAVMGEVTGAVTGGESHARVSAGIGEMSAFRGTVPVSVSVFGLSPEAQSRQVTVETPGRYRQASEQGVRTDEILDWDSVETDLDDGADDDAADSRDSRVSD